MSVFTAVFTWPVTLFASNIAILFSNIATSIATYIATKIAIFILSNRSANNKLDKIIANKLWEPWKQMDNFAILVEK